MLSVFCSKDDLETVHVAASHKLLAKALQSFLHKSVLAMYLMGCEMRLD